jgi:dipeptide/tripeptide permease
MVAVGLLLVGIGMAMLTVAQVDSSWTIALPGSIVAMIGTGLFNPSISNFALGSVPEHQSGLAAGANDTFRQAGIAVGVAALGALIPSGAVFAGGDQAAFVGGLHDALWVCAALCVVGAAACWALLRDPAPVEAADEAAELVLEAA